MNIQKLLLSTIASVAMTMGAVSTAGAGSADGSATAAVVTPVIVANQRDLNFGTFIVPGGGGSITIADAATGITYVGATVEGGGNSAVSGEFLITSTAGTSLTVNIVQNVLNLVGPGPTNMGFTVGAGSLPVSPATTFTSSGSDTLYVGGTITLVGGEPEGVYTAANAYTVTVNYQ